MLDDIDYSDLTSSAPAEAKPAKKSTINDRRMSAKPAEKLKPKPVDTEALATKVANLQDGLGAPKISDPMAEYGFPVIGVLGGLAAAYGLYQASKNKPVAGPVPPTASPPAGPNYNAYNSPAYLRNAPQATVTPATAPSTTAAPTPTAMTPAASPTLPPQANLTLKEVQARADMLKAAQPVPQTVAELDADFAGKDSIAAPAGTLEVPPQFSPGPVSPANVPPSPPYQPVATPLTAAPGAPAPAPSAAPGSPVTGIVADTIKELIDETPSAASLQPVEPPPLQTGTGKPAFAGQGPAPEIRAKGKKAGEPMLRNSYAKIENVPAGYAFVPGAQNIDTSRTNIGQAEYTKAYSQRPFPLTSEAAVLESSEINRILGRPTRAEAKAAGITLPPQTPGITKAVLESKESPFMGTKAAKVGGVLGALIAIPDLVNAQTVSQRGMAGANLLEAVLPPGFTMSGAGEGSANIPSMDAAMLLGSPYAQSDIAKRIRKDQEYTRKVGAGRGIAPPSAYQK